MNCRILATLLFIVSGPVLGADYQTVLDEIRLAQDVPGISATIVRGGEVVWSGGSGVADVEAGTPIAGDTPMYAGSLSKVFTSALTLVLVEKNNMRLSDNVADIAGRDDISVTHLLTHSSGLVREGNFDYWFNARFPDRQGLGNYLQTTQLRSAPGERVSYSNIGFAALGLHIEQETGQRYVEALQEILLGPLGIKNTGAPGPVENVARGYTPPGRIIPSAARPFAGVGKKSGDRHLREYHDAKAMTPAFGLYTSSADLGRLVNFIYGHLGTDLVSDELRQRLVSRQNGGRSLGLGISRYNGRPVASHGGWFAAHRSYLLLDLEHEIGIAVIGNGDNMNPEAVAYELLDLLLRTYPAS